MNPQQNISLANYSTMGLGGPAKYLLEVTEKNQIAEALAWAKSQNLACVMIGGGSNIIWGDQGFNGLVLVNKIIGYEVSQQDETNYYLIVGSGEPWDQVVERSVGLGLTGIEALSLIPGSTGATPIQNVGAYGQEISQSLVSVEAFDTEANKIIILAGPDCGFSYRSSRFKTSDRNRFYITSITLHLTMTNPLPPYYPAVQSYFDAHQITDITPAALRKAVVDIRTSKLPDPKIVHNCGSFFSNPIISKDEYEQLRIYFEGMPHWQSDDGAQVKLSAAWLVEHAGFKDYHDKETGMATWPRQPLVFVNEHAHKTSDLLAFKQKVFDSVKTKYGVELIQEPELFA